MKVHVSEEMRRRMDVLTPTHLVDAARALVFRLRYLHENFATKGGDAEKAARQHRRLCESLMNIVSALDAEEACREVAGELRAGLHAAFDSANSLDLR